MPTKFPKGSIKEQLPGTWWNSVMVMIRCPLCKHIARLSTAAGGHHIFSSGEVQPSLICPNDKCNFHEFVILEDWIDDKKER